MTRLETLVSHASASIGERRISKWATVLRAYMGLGDELTKLLATKNGFYAFESALHVFPLDGHGVHIGIELWNSDDLWRFEYGTLAENMLFFAEDCFGNQFCFHHGAIYTFEVETGDLKYISATLEEWAMKLLRDYKILTGYPLIHQWQTKHGKLQTGMRLMPRKPFVLGGTYDLKNIRAVRCVSLMRSMGNLARQICDLPDGSAIHFEME